MNHNKYFNPFIKDRKKKGTKIITIFGMQKGKALNLKKCQYPIAVKNLYEENTVV